MNELRSEPARLADLYQLVALDARSFSPTDRYRRREWAALLRDSLEGGPTRMLVARAPDLRDFLAQHPAQACTVRLEVRENNTSARRYTSTWASRRPAVSAATTPTAPP